MVEGCGNKLRGLKSKRTEVGDQSMQVSSFLFFFLLTQLRFSGKLGPDVGTTSRIASVFRYYAAHLTS